VRSTLQILQSELSDLQDAEHVTRIAFRLLLAALPTAAGLWLTCAIGIAVGLGRDSAAILCTLFALIVLSLVPKDKRHISPKD
jgi:uncharacterized membrane protein YhiD involved in acid resistance